MSDPLSTPWYYPIDMSMLCWEDYEEALLKLFTEPLTEATLPDATSLQALLSPTVSNQQGKAIQFVSPSSLPAGNYEELIFNLGKVSTRTNNWHDLFNALVWWRFPALKAAMNAVHFEEMQTQSGTGRGKLRDVLTLWDECGIIVASTNNQILESLASRNWQGAFQDLAGHWMKDVRVYICGHALLEKYLNPYKSITAQALLVQVDPVSCEGGRAELLSKLDRTLAAKLSQGDLLKTTADLSPLPLAGIPGWWKECEQDADFYADSSVFRIPAVPVNPAPVVRLDLG